MSTVLVVDDESDLAWLLRYNLEHEGYRTFVAPNGQAAVELVMAHRPDLMLLDLMMPIMDGWAVLEELDRIGSRPRVIVLSARTGTGERARAEQLKVEAFISKPFDMDELLELIRRLVTPASPEAAGPEGG